MAMLKSTIQTFALVCTVLASAVFLAACVNVSFDHGASRLDDKALVFGRIVLNRGGEELVVSPFSMPIAIRNIESAGEPKILAQNFEKDGRFYWALTPGRYQVSIVLHNYSGGVVSFSFNLEKPGRSYYFGDLTVHGQKRFDSLGSANMRGIRSELLDDFDNAQEELRRRNPQLNASSIERLVVRDMNNPEQRGVAYNEAMGTVRPCCAKLAQLPYMKLPADQKIEVKIGESSPVFDFPEGRSRFVAWELPSAHTHKTLALRSVVTPSGLPGTGNFYIFSPAVMLLDENFNVLADQHHGLFYPVAASMMPPRSASLRALIPPSELTSKAKYLIVYTSRPIIEGVWRTTRPGFIPIAGGVLPAGIPVGVSMEPAISGVIEAEFSPQ